MYKYLIICLLTYPTLLRSQEKLSYQKVDSLTYQYFLKGQWKELIDFSQKAEKQEINFKYLHQRLGYAYFMKSDYFAAEHQYEQAFDFDHFDPVTLEYLYYCRLYTGSEECSRYFARNLDVQTLKQLHVSKITPVDQVEAEYNYKTNDAITRSDPSYYRIGIKTLLGYQLSLTQSVSYFGQTIDAESVKQPEYYALLRWQPTSKIQIKGAFHGINTKIGIYNYPAYMGFLGVSSQLSRFNIEGNVSVLKLDTSTVQQFGIQAGVVLPGRSNLYFTGTLNAMSESSSTRAVYSQSAGLRCYKNLWAEANVTMGNLRNYSTLDALYVYNTIDPTVFRTGLTIFYQLNQHITLIGNFTYDQKEFNSSLINHQHYNQLSISGGIKWKL